MIWDERIEENLRNHDAYVNGKDEGFYDGKSVGEKIGKSIGEKIGKSIGEEKTRREMVMNMYKNNVSLDLIAKCSNLTMDEVKKIIDLNKEQN